MEEIKGTVSAQQVVTGTIGVGKGDTYTITEADYEAIGAIVEEKYVPELSTLREDITNQLVDVKHEAEQASVYVNNSGVVTSSSSAVSYILKCEPNTVYKVRKMVIDTTNGSYNRFAVGYCSEYPAVGVKCTYCAIKNNDPEICLKTNSDALYVIAYVYFPVSGSPASKEEVLNSVQICRETISATSNIEVYDKHTDSECYNAFLDAMNDKAQQMGMTNSVFKSASGLSSLTFTTPLDLGKLGLAVAGNSRLLDWCSVREATLHIYGTNEHAENPIVKSNIMMNGRIGKNYNLLGGKGGSMTQTINGVSTSVVNYLYIIDVGGTPCVVAIMSSGKASDVDADTNHPVNRISYSSEQVINLMEKELGVRSGTVATNDLDNLVSSGCGGYVAFPIPNASAVYCNNFPTEKIKTLPHCIFGGEDRVLAPASVTKLMTCLVALDYIDNIHKRVFVRTNDISSGSGSDYKLWDEFDFDEAVRMCLAESSNTLALMIARVIGQIILHAKRSSE